MNILEKNSVARENILLTKIVCRIMLTSPARIRDMSASKHWLSAQQAFTFARQSPVNLFRTRRFMRLELIGARQLISGQLISA
jgi:ABC-type cobalamin transport system permease subunit